MSLSGPPMPHMEHCSRMLDSVSLWGPPLMTSHVWVLILSCSLHFQPALSELVFSNRPEDGVGVLGSPLTLHCAVYDFSQQRALPVGWERASGEPGPAAALSPETNIHQMANGSLFFPRLREGDLGRYVCNAGTGSKHIRTIVQVEKADLQAVFFSPQSQMVSEGQAVFFQCVSGDSSPAAYIAWLKDGTLFTKGKQIQGQYGGGNQRKTSGTLHLSNVSVEDEGKYICVTHNPLLNTSREGNAATLTVQGVPRRLRITRGPDNITVAIATEAAMRCVVRGDSAFTVRWLKDERLLMNSSALTLQDNGQRLLFTNVSVEDEGFYHCEARDERETVRSQPAFLLSAVMGWNFVQQPNNKTVKRGDSVTLACRPPHSRPKARLSWFKNNRLLTPKPHFTVGLGGDLIFHSAQDTDSGMYFCRASNSYLHRSVTSRRASLNVLVPPSVKLWPPVATVPLGAQVVFQCQVWGHPLPSVIWSKQGRYMQTGGKVTVGMKNATLYILSVRSYDEGTYTCEASNTVGRDQSTATLHVAVSPIIVSFMRAVSSSEGVSVVLPCRAVGVLPISYTWTRGRGASQISITSSHLRHIDDEGALHISSVQWSDAGDYHCTAENRVGREQRSATLTVSAEDDPADKQTRQILSAVRSTETAQITSVYKDNHFLQHSETTHPHVSQKGESTGQASHGASSTHVTPVSTLDNSRQLTSPREITFMSPDPHSKLPLDKPLDNPTQPPVTQIQSPVLQPPHLDLYQPSDPLTQPSFHGILPSLSHTQPPVTHIKPPSTYNQSPLTHNRLSVPHTQSLLTQTQFQHTHSQPSVMHIQHQVTDTQLQDRPTQSPDPVTSITLVSLPQSSPVSPTQLPDHFTQFPDPLTQSLPTQALLPDLQTHGISVSLNKISLFDDVQPPDLLTLTHRPVTQTRTLDPHLQPHIQTHLPNTQPQLPHTQTHLPHTQPSVSNTQPPEVSPRPPTPVSQGPSVHQVTTSEPQQQNASQPADPAHPAKSAGLNDTEPTEWLKRNTSQSPMRTSNDPRVKPPSSWLPVLEKHDIPIVVGVGVSLAFIFITMAFYSLVQKNEPGPIMCRGVQRNLGVPCRHPDRLATGRTYENRAFEDDDMVAVIEQSPNTSNTRARPLAPSPVTIQMEPSSDELQEEEPQTQPTPDPSVTAETYLEPSEDTQIDPSLEEEKGCTLSHPSIQLQCVEDWGGGGGGVEYTPCQDALPPPSPPSPPHRSPSPSPPPMREEGLRSSLTLQTANLGAPPVRHSLSISHGNAPLLLSHCVSLGLTTVAVDVHFYPAAPTTTTTAAPVPTQLTSITTTAAAPAPGPQLSSRLAHNQEIDQSTPSVHQNK